MPSGIAYAARSYGARRKNQVFVDVVARRVTFKRHHGLWLLELGPPGLPSEEQTNRANEHRVMTRQTRLGARSLCGKQSRTTDTLDKLTHLPTGTGTRIWQGLAKLTPQN